MKQSGSNTPPKKTRKSEPSNPVVNPELNKPKKIEWEGWVIVLTAAIYYINTIGNGHALDDVTVILMNSFTKKGFHGIWGILSKDSMYGFIGGDNPLPGGRYRPLSLITFAIEWQLFGDSPAVGHFINVVLYAFTGWLLWLVLKKFIFKASPWIAFITAMLFVIHPIHTEVVANIKSRDEILSLLGSLGALYYLFSFTETRHEIKYLILSSICFSLGLFAKENTITYLAIMPMALFFFSRTDFKSNLKYLAPHVILAGVFIIIRSSVVGTPHAVVAPEIMNDPFLHASFIQKYSTIFLTLLYYIKLLFYPYPLSHDYSFNQIPLTSFTDWRVILSVLFYLAIFIYAILTIKRKSVISFGILYFLITLFITSNLVINVGAPMGERFLYMPSIGFCMIMAVAIYKGYNWLREKAGKSISIGLSSGIAFVILIASCSETIARNNNWANDIILDTHDAAVVPNSAMALQRCGTAYIYISDSVKRGHCDSIPDKSSWKHYLLVADNYFDKSLKIYPQYVNGFLNLGCSKLRQNQFEAAEADWDSAEKYQPDHPLIKVYRNNLGNAYLDSANSSHEKGKLDVAYKCLLKAAALTPDNPEVYYNLGGYYFTIHDFAKAKENWQKCIEINPNHEQAKNGLKAVEAVGK